eukprot:gene25281-10934_t
MSTSCSRNSTGLLSTTGKGNDVFGYESPPGIPSVAPVALKWVQGLDLSHSLRNVRRDTANGFLVAEIFSRYFPKDIQMHSFSNVTATVNKRNNWDQLKTYCERQEIDFPVDLVEGTLAGVHGAAVALIEHLYEVFTGKKVQRMALPEGMANTANLASAGTSSAADAAAPIEFGAVSTHAVGDAMDLRRKLAADAAANAT